MSRFGNITGLKSYQGYEDSHIPWLGVVPAHWDVLALKHLCWFKSGAGFPVVQQGLGNLEIPFFKVSDMTLPGNGKVMTVWNNSISRSTAASLGATIFPAGTIVFPKVGGAMLTNKRRVVEKPCCIDNNLMGCIVKRGDARFILVLLQHLDFAAIAKPGPVPAISEGDVGEIRIALPPHDEQNAIVRFLDYTDRRIRLSVRAKQKLSQLLEEQKRAFIHSAVTRGLDSNVRLKPSGWGWLGDVPEHWAIVSAKQVSQIFVPQRDKPELNEQEGSPWVTPECIGAKDISFSTSLVSPQTAKAAGCRPVPPGSVIASCVGRFGLASINERPVIINQQLQAYIPLPVIDASYLRYFIQVSKPYFEMKGNSTTLAYVNRQGFGDLPVVVPPVSEQEAIVSFIEEYESRLDVAAANASRGVELTGPRELVRAL